MHQRVQNILSSIRARLRGESQEELYDDKLFVYINLAQDYIFGEIVGKVKTTKRVFFVSDEHKYELGDNTQVTRVVDNNKVRLLERGPLMVEYGSVAGNPQYYAVVDDELWLFPTPVDDLGYVDVDCSKERAIVPVDADTPPELPSQLDNALATQTLVELCISGYIDARKLNPISAMADKQIARYLANHSGSEEVAIPLLREDYG